MRDELPSGRRYGESREALCQGAGLGYDTCLSLAASAVRRCFATPGACGYPDPAYGNVGVPAGKALRPSGSISVTTDGTVIDGRDVAGTIRVNARNVTIRNTRVTVTGAGCGPTSACGNSRSLSPAPAP